MFANSIFLYYLLAQNEVNLNEILERFYEDMGSDIRIDQFEDYFKEPIDLTKENIDKICSFLRINRGQANALLRMVRNKMSMADICDSLGLSELQCSLLKFSTKVLRVQQDKISIKKTQSTPNMSFELKSRFYCQLPENRNFVGDIVNSYQRAEINFQPYRFGISFTKNAGELSYWEKHKFSGVYDKDFLKLVVGRFSYKNYFGIVLGEPFGVNKGGDVIERALGTSVKINSSLSSMEYGIFNGIALTTNCDFYESFRVKISGFVSKIKRSGTFDTLRNLITSVYTQDYYRDSNELKKKDTFNEVAYCIQSDLSTGRLTLGYSFFFLNYSKYISTSSRKFIDGRNSNFHSFFLSYNFFNVLDFGAQYSLDGKKNIGIVSNLSLKKKHFNTSLNFRYFSEQFRSPFGAVLAENSYPNNELGIFYHFQLKLKDFDFQLYSDFFKALSQASLLQVPYYGNEVFLQAIFSPTKDLSTRFKLRRKEKTDYVFNIQKTKQLPYQKISYNLFFEGKFSALDKWVIKCRFDRIWINNREMKSNENGFHILLELSFSPKSFCNAGSRMSYFSTKSFESAIYVFEILAPEFMYSSPFYDKGIRLTFWSKFQIFNWFSLYLKYYWDRKDITKQFVLGQLDFIYRF